MAATTASSSAASTPPTPPSTLPIFARVTSASLLQRNASTSSSISTTTSESSSSLVAVPIRPPPIETRTAATPEAQLPAGVTADYDDEPPRGHYGGRGFIHNGPRMKKPEGPGRSWSQPPAIVTTSSPTQALPPNRSPVTPRATRLPLPDPPMPAPIPVSPRQLRVSIGDDEEELPSTPSRPRISSSMSPSTPTVALGGTKSRTRSMDNTNMTLPDARERRQSQVSTKSNVSSSSRKPSLRDYTLGHELGRGSYSTVVLATAAGNGGLSASPRAPAQQFAIKIMNQAHLIQEKKAKYAHIERDALIRLSLPRSTNSPTMTHRRGMSNSSSNTVRSGKTMAQARRDRGSTGTPSTLSPRDRQLESPTTFTQQLSPLATNVRLTREPQDLEDRSAGFSSKPPSPVKEESSDGHSEGGNGSESHIKVNKEADMSGSQRIRTPRKRRQSLAPSERSTRSTSGGSQVFGHPGIIRLYSTFADKISVYYVLELASNGELASVIRSLGSLDITSARYYAAQLIDTLEFIHEREVIHRDIKPENILLDSERRLKVTDFGSAKILGRKEDGPEETSKRSFVGSADYVSPEVLRNEPASYASDIWAFGVVLYNFITGKSPFRSATEFLTFQKVLKCELEFPEGFDEQARNLIERCLDLEPTNRPTAQQLKSDPFFSSIDWSTIWQIPAPEAVTGMSKPQETLANIRLDSDVWAVFDEDGSEGNVSSPGDDHDPHSQEPQYDRYAAASAVKAVDNCYDDDELDPPRRGWLGGPGPLTHKPRGWSTSSSSSGGRLSGLLDAVGINPPFTPPNARIGSGRVSRASDYEQYTGGSSPSRSRTQSPETVKFRGVNHADNSKWTPLLVANERIILSTPILVKPSNNVPLPAFLLPSSKKRQLIMTDAPRLLCVKEDDNGEARVKYEFAFVSHPRGKRATSVNSNGSGSKTQSPEHSINYILDIQEKGSKVFVVQTATHTFTFFAETADVRSAWMHTFKRVGVV